MKAAGNVYFEARKNAAKYNDRLSSRDGAAELLGVSVSTLADYELGNTKVVPVDKAVLMADLYNCPEIKAAYCKNECPIGRLMPIATEADILERAVLRLVNGLDPDRVAGLLDRAVRIAMDGKVGDDEKEEMAEIMAQIDEIAVVLGELRMLGEKALNGRG